MSAELSESIRVYIRYEIPDENNRTRRERNEIVGEFTPDINIPIAGKYLWDIYFSISDSIQRVRDGICSPIPPSEFKYYFELTETIVYSHEYDILRNMDRQFCSEMNKELQAYQERQHEELKNKR